MQNLLYLPFLARFQFWTLLSLSRASYPVLFPLIIFFFPLKTIIQIVHRGYIQGLFNLTFFSIHLRLENIIHNFYIFYFYFSTTFVEFFFYNLLSLFVFTKINSSCQGRFDKKINFRIYWNVLYFFNSIVIIVFYTFFFQLKLMAIKNDWSIDDVIDVGRFFVSLLRGRKKWTFG